MKAPRPRLILALILVVYLVLGILFAANTPAWQAPDEPAHYNYVRYLAENGSFPVLHIGDYPHAYLEQIKSRRVSARHAASTPSATSPTSRRCTTCSPRRSTA